MIVGSLLLLLTGVALLVTGLIQGDDTYLVGAIIAALLAAVCLYGASRRTKSRKASAARSHTAQRAARSRADDAETDSRLRGREEDATAMVPRARKDEPAEREEPAEETSGGGRPTVDLDVETDTVPSDEPAEITMSSVEAAALMRMDAEVMVVDGRPRFHLGGCVHLVGRDSESLPAYEAVELGFGPCALCRPAQSLLREPTRR